MADSEANHNGGLLLFGPDKHLYIGTGDGGGGGRPARRPRQRAEPRRRCSARSCGSTRSRPAGSPTPSPPTTRSVGRAGARGEIYSYGLRNPWRFSFDRRTGDLSIGDVGQNAVEEIDFVRRGKGRGANFGWRPFEGRSRFTPGRERARPRPARHHAHPRRRLVLDHRRRRGPRPRARRAARALPVRRLLQAADPLGDAQRRARDVGPAHTSLQVEQPLLVRRGRARPRLRRVAERPGLPARRRDEHRRARGAGHRARPGGEPRAVHAVRHQHLGRRARPGLGHRPRPRHRTTTSTASPPRSRRAAVPAGSRSRTTTCDHVEGLLALRERLGRPRVGARALRGRRAARRRRPLRPAGRALRPGPRAGPPGVRVARAPASPATPCSARAACSSPRTSAEYLEALAAPAPAPARGHLPRPRPAGVGPAGQARASTSPTAASASASCSTRSTTGYARRTSCSTPCGTTRRPRCGRRRRSRWGRTERSCAPRVAGLSQAAVRQRHSGGQRGRPRPPRPRRRSSAACRRRRARAARRARRA